MAERGKRFIFLLVFEIIILNYFHCDELHELLFALHAMIIQARTKLKEVASYFESDVFGPHVG